MMILRAMMRHLLGAYLYNNSEPTPGEVHITVIRLYTPPT